MVSQSLTQLLEKHVSLELECIDRMYLNGYVPLLQTGGGISYFFQEIRNMPIASSVLMGKMTEKFVSSIKQYIDDHDIELVRFKNGQRKDTTTQEKLSCHDGSEKILYIGVAQERANVFRTIGKTNPDTGERYPWLNKTTVMCNHYYFYIFDKDFGPMFIKFCSYFPYTVRVCINGHEYLKQQLLRRGVAFQALDNGILSCEDPERMQAIADALDEKKIKKVFEKWLKKLPNPFSLWKQNPVSKSHSIS